MGKCETIGDAPPTIHDQLLPTQLVIHLHRSECTSKILATKLCNVHTVLQFILPNENTIFASIYFKLPVETQNHAREITPDWATKLILLKNINVVINVQTRS